MARGTPPKVIASSIGRHVDTVTRCRLLRGIMIWAGIVGDELIWPFRVLYGDKIISASYCPFLESNLLPWLDDVPLQQRKTFVFQHYNAPAYFTKATEHFLASLWISGKRLMVWPPCSPDLNPIENLWAILKRDIYKDWKQFTSKEDLCRSIQVSANNLSRFEIKKLTESPDKRIVKVIQRNGSFVNY